MDQRGSLPKRLQTLQAAAALREVSFHGRGFLMGELAAYEPFQILGRGTGGRVTHGFLSTTQAEVRARG